MIESVQQTQALLGKHVVFTGGSGVLGCTLCKGLLEAGASVTVISRQPGKVFEHPGMTFHDETLQCLSADVLDEASVSATVAPILERFSKIDILINAAGGNRPDAITDDDKSFFALRLDAIDAVVRLNFSGTLIPSHLFGREMAKVRQGNIINISSMAAIRPLTRVVGYAAAKAAVNNFTQWLAVEMAHKYGERIRVNAIAPGFFLTEQNRALLTNPDGTFTDRGEAILRNTPFRRFGKPEELLGTLYYLCSDASRFVTGIVIPVDGGYSAFGGI
jgi:NAD(P)-dependent dehydrogenase (short-subunit alcohol dehydrogenase family)